MLKRLTVFGTKSVKSVRGISMTALVSTAFGALLTVSMLLVLGLAVTANIRNTFSLLNDKAVLTTNALAQQVSDHLDLAAGAVLELKNLFDNREIGLDQFEQLKPSLLAAVYSNMVIDVLVITDVSGEEFGIYRGETGRLWPFQRQQVPEVSERYVLPKVTARSGATWGPLVQASGELYANVTVPLVNNGMLSGYLTAAVSTEEIGNAVRQLDGGDDATVFILANGDEVIAYSDLALVRALTGKSIDLPATISELGDSVLSGLATGELMETFEKASALGVDVRDIESHDDGPDHLSMTKRLEGYGPDVWIVGQYYEASTISREIRRLFGSATVGLVSIVIALVLAVLLLRRAARPLEEIAKRAQYIGALEFDRVKPLPQSRIRELDQVYQAFNAMVVGLRAMNTYVPRSLFRKLMRLGMDQAMVAREMEITLVFTDIVGFTSLSENLTAVETAEALNQHFALLVAAVEREGGTVDKFIGDGMLAFWGAPDARPDHARAAVRACVGMASALRADNRACAERGEPPMRLRIGIHSGKVVVGNVGALDRWNYTVVGDAVNLCERLQSLGRDVSPDDEVVILASEDTIRRAGGGIASSPAGTHRLRGRSGAVTVWRVDDRASPLIGDLPAASSVGAAE
ncbi:adenylate/guanylate cyclase domain-containing protein [Stappia indica]|uniref:adenylate/guanylate cyclase domain-containing protein n=1 Tax=Stappia indica TaxID=538381 RepID=UPI001CD6FA8E|nr:adenylate/guanylate cyclase domain-containing protein [Stappia indica]MCA1297527.1 adenylate/guanylate cyclase domain-containing protein [Stappia indica]